MKYNSESKTVAPRAQPLLNEGTRLLREGKVAEAIDSLERAREIDAASVPILLNLGGAYVMAGSHRKAIQPLEAARDVEPQNAMVWINLGAAYLGNPVLATPEQQLDAIRAFERALQLDPAAPSVHYNLGLIYVDSGPSRPGGRGVPKSDRGESPRPGCKTLARQGGSPGGEKHR